MLFRKRVCESVCVCPRGALLGRVHEAGAVQHGCVPPAPQHLQQCFLGFQSIEVFTWKCRSCTSRSELSDNNSAFPSDILWNSIEANCGNLLFLHPETLCTTEKATGPNRCVQTRERHQTKLPVVEWGQWTMQKCREKNWKDSLAGNWQWEHSGRSLRKIYSDKFWLFAVCD